MKFLLIVATLFSFSLSVAHAKDKASKAEKSASDDSYGGTPWGMAGCSVWNYVIKDKETGPQIGVWVLEHLVFGVQTFAISSGSSNCVNTNKLAANEQEVFVNVNLASLQKEAAQGQGDHLATLAEIFGCSNKDAFAQMSQTRYEAIFTNENSTDIVQSYKNEIKSSAQMACSRAG